MTRTLHESRTVTFTQRMRLMAIPGIAAVLALSACSGGGGGDSSFAGENASGQTEKSTFEEFNSCDAFVSWTKAEMLKRVGPYGLEAYPWLYARSAEGLNEAPMADVVTSSGGVMPDTSVTNTQEADVDEGDIVETDGRFVYSIVDNRLRSVDLDASALLEEIDLPSGDSQMILSGDRLVVVTSQWDATADTIITSYGVSEGKLTFESRTHLEGQQVSVRSVGDNVYITIRSGIVERLDFVTPRDGTDSALKTAEKRNREVVKALTADQIVPRMFDESELGARSEISTALDCSVIGHPNVFSGWGLTWVARVSTTADSAIVGDVGILADSQNAYTSSNSLYVATTRWDDASEGEVVPMKPEPVHTDLHAFSLDAESGAFSYAASGRVLGTLLNSYSMSEFDGVLRVATTSYEYDFGKGQDNGVHTFRVENGDLVELGSVRGLGRGEMIQGVRFDGPRGYVVTFRQVDPLYVLDLSNPEMPELVGELKVPGYSTYLKPIDGDRVIAVGMSGTETGFITGVQVSVFDVADPSDPQLIATSDIGDWSEATWDPHAFLWWSQTGQIVVPRELVCEVPGSTECGSAVVLRLEGTNLSEQGRIVQWFPIRRSVIAQGRLVTVSAGAVLVTDLDSLRSTLEIRFDVPGFDGEEHFPPLID